MSKKPCETNKNERKGETINKTTISLAIHLVDMRETERNPTEMREDDKGKQGRETKKYKLQS